MGDVRLVAPGLPAGDEILAGRDVAISLYQVRALNVDVGHVLRRVNGPRRTAGAGP